MPHSAGVSPSAELGGPGEIDTLESERQRKEVRAFYSSTTCSNVSHLGIENEKRNSGETALIC